MATRLLNGAAVADIVKEKSSAGTQSDTAAFYNGADIVGYEALDPKVSHTGKRHARAQTKNALSHHRFGDGNTRAKRSRATTCFLNVLFRRNRVRPGVWRARVLRS